MTVATLSKDWIGNHIIEYSTISFTFYPETGKLISLTILSPYWYTIPSNFPINISPKEATMAAKDIATKYMQINEITSTPNKLYRNKQSPLLYYNSIWETGKLLQKLDKKAAVLTVGYIVERFNFSDIRCFEHVARMWSGMSKSWNKAPD